MICLHGHFLGTLLILTIFTVFYFASSLCTCVYEKFPEVLMIDGTYNVIASHMPLYSFMINPLRLILIIFMHVIYEKPL